jgi:hypothetical protein
VQSITGTRNTALFVHSLNKAEVLHFKVHIESLFMRFIHVNNVPMNILHAIGKMTTPHPILADAGIDTLM